MEISHDMWAFAYPRQALELPFLGIFSILGLPLPGDIPDMWAFAYPRQALEFPFLEIFSIFGLSCPTDLRSAE